MFFNNLCDLGWVKSKFHCKIEGDINVDLDKYSENYSGKTLKRFRDKICIPESESESESDCWEWDVYTDRAGYGMFYANGKPILAHRFSYQIFKGKIPKGLIVCHNCDNPGCVNPKHLKLGDQQDNMNDMYLRERQPKSKGEDNGFSTLTEKQVRNILIRINNGEFKSIGEIASEYNVSIGCIYFILDGKTWIHITNQLTTPLAEIKAKIVRQSLCGSNNYNVKLSKSQVLDIKKRIRIGELCINIAKLYNVSTSAISDIRCNKTWKDV